MANVQLYSVSKHDVVSDNIDINTALSAALDPNYYYYVRVTNLVAEDVEKFKEAELFKDHPKYRKTETRKMPWEYGWLCNIFRNNHLIYSGSWSSDILNKVGSNDVLCIYPVAIG